MTVTIDAAGRLVVPKALRDAAGLRPGMVLEIRAQGDKIEIQPASSSVRIVQQGPLAVLHHVDTRELLTEETVLTLRSMLRNRASDF